ncbi:MAG: FecR domain-containing protein [Kofleriaceae bacterium]
MTRSDDYLWDRSGEDPEAARLEALLAPLAHRAPLDELRMRRPRRSRAPIYVAAGIAAALAVVVLWRVTSKDAATCAGSTGFTFTAQGGNVACGAASVASGELPVGTVLDTGAHTAELAISTIGKAQLGANTRVRLEHTSGNRHQLYLAQGHMHARVSAPPRIFAVSTPSANVTDLGCEYTLDIDAAGAGWLDVITGKVELETEEHTIVVAPAGTRVRMLAGRKPGVPLSHRAGPEITAALRDFEATSTADALARVLAASTIADVITVANLAVIVPADRKRTVLERLAALVAPPQDLAIDEALSDPALFEMWFDEAVLVHLGVAAAKTP